MKAEWYVIQVISWTEENVRQSLFQRRESFSLEDYILDVFVPTHDVVSVRAWGEQVKKKKNNHITGKRNFNLFFCFIFVIINSKSNSQ